jgi:hypothetical protein
VAEGEIQLLVKSKALPQRFALGEGRGAPRVTAEPLFASIGQGESGLAAAEAEQWHLVAAEEPDDRSPWDLCHRMLSEGLGFAGAPAVAFAEPDLVQQFMTGDGQGDARKAAAGCPASGDPQDPRFPRVEAGGADVPLWFARPEFSQFAGIPPDPGPRPVRVAHIDTGYDPRHQTLPAGLRTDLQRSFIQGEKPDSAVDTTKGPLTNPGHGTGTLSILAGKGMGAAPGVEVVPIRVADRVVLFRNSAVARAFDYVHRLCDNPVTFVHAITMSMGGVASQAWADAINALYERGVFIACAAGNNFGNLPTHHIVYPARFNRVTAACGVMANLQPYADLAINLMAGNYGPAEKMRTAIAACTPNLPWARRGCAAIVDLDGAGTSAATPQVAAAAALWIGRHRGAWEAYAQGWMRVEAVRKALFESATAGDPVRLGHGRLRAADALALQPAAAADLRKQPADRASFAALRVLTGLGAAAVPDARQEMLELEALQLSAVPEIEALLPDGPDVAPSDPGDLQRLREALAEQPGASKALRLALGAAPAARRGRVGMMGALPGLDTIAESQLAHALDPPVPTPERRRLRVFAFDPSLGERLETLALNVATVEVPWEPLSPGPVGRYLDVVDIDPASRCAYAPVDLDQPGLLASEGLAPTESDPRFHQQMTYAVAMRTIAEFEGALGRVALWAPHVETGWRGKLVERFVERLRIHPHAIRAANAYYSPDRKALLFGYFRNTLASATPEAGGLVFTCLSHDVVAHETTHALLDGLHRRFRDPTNPDVLAFHEAFSDIVALFQHFSIPEALRAEIARTRGDLGQQTMLGALAQQFGQALQGHGALRDFLGGYEERDGAMVWVPRAPRVTDYGASEQPHARGAVLVAAVFDAFLQIYRRRAADLIRLATGGSGILPPGEIPPDLVNRLADEASRASRHVLRMCIRALDYCPPIDITFGEYLRALVTADSDMVPEDPLAYRTAFVAAFRARGIRPEGIRFVAADALLWDAPAAQPETLREILPEIDRGWRLRSDRERIHAISLENAERFRRWLTSAAVADHELSAFGLRRKTGPLTLTLSDGRPLSGSLGPIEVHSVRPARRVGPEGDVIRDLVAEITQAWTPDAPPSRAFRGGCTLLIDVEAARVRYCIRKSVANPRRVADQLAFLTVPGDHAAAGAYFARGERGREPFALLHGDVDREADDGGLA